MDNSLKYFKKAVTSSDDSSVVIYGNDGSNNQVVLTDSSGRIVVSPTGSSSTDIEFQSATGVVPNVETTILSFTNTGATLYIDAVGGTGNASTVWNVYINTVLKVKRQSNVAHPNLEVPMHGFEISNSDIVDIKAEHCEKTNKDFQAEVRYFR